MELNNIEKQIREKLNTREIQPTLQAWDRLDAMLSVAEEKKTKRSFGWLYIAASILVFATVGTFLYNQEKTTIQPIESVVMNEITNDSLQTNSSKEKITDDFVPQQNAQQLVQETTSQHNKSRASVSSTLQNKSTINQKATVNQNPIIQQNEQEIAVIHPEKQTLIENPKIIVEQQQQQIAVASNEMPSKNATTSKVKVNANSLLSEVDGELELTFREKVLQKVTKNYKEVKVAVSNRNQQ